MTGRRLASRPRLALPALATGLALLALLLAAAVISLSLLAWQSVASGAGPDVTFLAIAVAGLVVARREPRNPIGWLLLAIPVGVLLSDASGPYAWLAYRSGQRLPFGPAVLLLSGAWTVLVLAFPLVVLLFPYGRLPSPRWRWVLWAYLAATASLVACVYVAIVSVIAAHHVDIDSTGGLAALDDPSGRTAWLSTALLLIIPVLVAFWLVFAGRLVLSWRRADGERRQQLEMGDERVGGRNRRWSRKQHRLGARPACAGGRSGNRRSPQRCRRGGVRGLCRDSDPEVSAV